MSNLFLIGNGFDLACGLKTRYTDAYKGYIQTKSSSKVIEEFKSNISSDIATWGDFELEISNYAKHLNTEEELISCVRDFKRYLIGYLKKQEADFLSMSRGKADVVKAIGTEMGISISSFYENSTNNSINAARKNNYQYGNNNSYISFNYTNVFDKALEKCYVDGTNYYIGARSEVIHIHGSLMEGDSTLGVDNEGQIAAKFELSDNGRRTIIKPRFNEEYDSQRVMQARQLIYQASNICVYGMSLGDSDLTWRNLLLEWLIQDSSRQLFLYYYDLSKERGLMADEKLELEETTKEGFIKKWDAEKYSEAFKRIHIPCGADIFNIEKAISQGNQAHLRRANPKPENN